MSNIDIVQLLSENYLIVIGTGVVALLLLFVVGGRKHPLEAPYVNKGIPVLGNFFAFAKGTDL